MSCLRIVTSGRAALCTTGGGPWRSICWRCAPQRSQANAAFSLVSGVTAILVLAVSGVLFERVGHAAPFVLVALGTLLLAGLGVLGVREPPPATPAAQTPLHVWGTL